MTPQLQLSLHLLLSSLTALSHLLLPEFPPCVGRSPTKELVLMGVFNNSQLGSAQRVRKKIFNLHQRGIQEAEAHQQTLQEAQALDQRVKDAEAKAQDLQTQLESSRNAYQELEQSLQVLL